MKKDKDNNNKLIIENTGYDNNDEDYWNKGIFDPAGLNPNPLNNQAYSSHYKTLSKFWSNLPSYAMGKQIVNTIISNDVILIKSATGSGKSVLIPKFALHSINYMGKIIMSLPKKIITKKAAEFGASTLDVKLGEQVGYQFRGESNKSSRTVLTYTTDGSIISMLKFDPMLKSIDIVIIDEAHERKVNIDLLLYMLKNSIQLRKKKNFSPLKLIIMSATINEEIFKSYYKDYKFEWLELAGTPNHPIKSIYLESELNLKSNEYLEKGQEIIAQIISNINISNPNYMEGDILFFVCTISECDDLTEKLSEMYSDCFVMGLYSGFDSELEPYISDPNKYKQLNSKYKRRLFISTNVAESSLTIDGIVYVIDSGLEIKVRFDPETNINQMEKGFITQAQMTQRKGRAGRTKPGICYHLYTPQQYENVLKFPEPEIKCIDLKNTCLSLMKMCGDINLSGFNNSNNSCDMESTIEMFLHFIEPPGEKFITNGFDFAISYGLIGKDNKLSKLGYLCVESRLDVMDGLSLIWAWNISSLVFKAVFKIISICSFLKSGIDNLFYDDVDNEIKNKIISKLFAKSDNSEHVLLYELYKYIETNKNSGLFNIELFDSIQSAYSRQLEKLEKIYSKYNIKLYEVKKKDFNTNIINSFGYGYKSNRAFKSSQGYKFNGVLVDLKKSIIKPNEKINSIIFYSNLNWSGRLNLIICSPYLLK